MITFTLNGDTLAFRDLQSRATVCWHMPGSAQGPWCIRLQCWSMSGIRCRPSWAVSTALRAGPRRANAAGSHVLASAANEWPGRHARGTECMGSRQTNVSIRVARVTAAVRLPPSVPSAYRAATTRMVLRDSLTTADRFHHHHCSILRLELRLSGLFVVVVVEFLRAHHDSFTPPAAASPPTFFRACLGTRSFPALLHDS